MQVEKRHSNELTSPTPSVVCAKLFCAEKASASLVFNPRRAEAWLLPEPVATEDSISMCRFHAEIFRAPVDWVFTDQRITEDESAGTGRACGNLRNIQAKRFLLRWICFIRENGSSEEGGLSSEEEVESLAVSDESESDSPENDKTPLLARAFRNSQSLLGES